MRLTNEIDGKVCYLPVRRDGVYFLSGTLMLTPLGMSLFYTLEEGDALFFREGGGTFPPGVGPKGQYVA